jgi:hypothetical protein
MTPQPTWIGVIESIVKVGALILAGFWTVYVFRALGQREKANADLKKAQSETQKIDAEKSKLELDMRKAELDMRRVAILQTEIEATVNRAHDGVGYYILVGVNLKNIGTRFARINWEGQPVAFTIRRAKFGADGAPSFPWDPIPMHVVDSEDPNKSPEAWALLPGATGRLAFAAYVSHQGVYLMCFRGRANLPETEDPTKGPEEKASWSSTKYIVVGESTSEPKIASTRA